MTTQRKLPDITTIKRLRRKGMLLRDIGEAYGVTEQAVWQALHLAGEVPRQATYRDIAPWRVERAHREAQPMRNIQNMVRRNNGRSLDEAAERRLNDWLKGMEEAGVALCYHPDAPANAASLRGGFYYVTRAPGDDSIFVTPAL